MSDPIPPTPPQPPIAYPQHYGSTTNYNCIWDVATLQWIRMTAAAGSAGPVSVADGADVAQGTTTDVAWVSGAGTVIALLKKIASAGGSAVSIADAADVAQGALADAAVQGDTAGSLSAKLRGLNKSIAAGLAVTNAGLTNLDVALSTRTKPADQQHAIIDSGTTTVTQATAANLNATVVGTGTFAAQVTGTVTTTPPANASTNVAQFGGSNVTIGQQVAGSSLPVILPSATITTLTPPAAITGFALEAGHLAAIDTSTAKIPAQGQALAAASMPVVLTAAQITTLTPPAAIAGFALEATQLTGNTSIASVKTNTDPLVASGAGGYVRQDSTATIAKESGGNLATIVTNTTGGATAAAQTAAQTTLTSLEARTRINQDDVLSLILTELRAQNYLLAAGLNVRDDVDLLRRDMDLVTTAQLN